MHGMVLCGLLGDLLFILIKEHMTRLRLSLKVLKCPLAAWSPHGILEKPEKSWNLKSKPGKP